MKYIDPDVLDQLPGRRLAETESFTFDCHSKIPCFNRCCRNLNLFLYPYDVLRLKNRLGLSSGRFLDQYVDVVLREGSFFPDVLLKMRDAENQSCSFLSETGCLVYIRTARIPAANFRWSRPILSVSGQRARCSGSIFSGRPNSAGGPQEKKVWTAATWNSDSRCNSVR